MKRLLLAELRRVVARRLVRTVVAVAGFAVAIGGVAAFVSTDDLSAAAYHERVREADARAEAQQADVAECLRDHGVSRGESIPEAVARRCVPDESPRANDPRFHRSRLEGILRGASGVLAIVGWAVGASLIGAEYASRGLATLLTWETRRPRIFMAKLIAVLAASAFLAVGVLILVVVAMVPALALHGGPPRASDPSAASLVATIARGGALAAFAAGAGFAIAIVGRNTAAALGAGFAYIVVFENILGSSVERWRRWLLLGNAIVFVTGDSNGGDVPGRTVAAAGLFLVTVTVTLLIAAAGAFRSRDVT